MDKKVSIKGSRTKVQNQPKKSETKKSEPQKSEKGSKKSLTSVVSGASTVSKALGKCRPLGATLLHVPPPIPRGCLQWLADCVGGCVCGWMVIKRVFR